jgi:hypothetical protein
MTMQSWNVSSGHSSTNGRSSNPSTTSPTQGSACSNTSKPSTTQSEFTRPSDTEHLTKLKNPTKQNQPSKNLFQVSISAGQSQSPSDFGSRPPPRVRALITKTLS